jgi:xanthine dehydrogenase small subunit
MAAIPKRAPACEAALTGRPWARETVVAAAAALADDFTPITDMRASAAYRLEAAQNLLLRAYLEDAEARPGVLDAQAVAYG